jgi:hypothetical protein
MTEVIVVGNANQNLAEVIEEVATTKRTRRAPVVKTVTAGEIIAEITGLEKAVADLENAIATIDPSNIIFQLAEKELNGKKKELADALDSVYKI